MDTNDENKIKLQNLLETYSVQEVSNIFADIDDKILSLHGTSSEDFYNLNKDFKHFYNVANQISENASSLFDFIASNENNGFLKDIEKFYEALDAKSKLLDYHLEITRDIINNILSGIRHSFFPIKNFKQNLTSLIFLETNLKFDKQDESDSNKETVVEIAQSIKEELSFLEKLFANLKRIIKEDSDADKIRYDDLKIAEVLDRLKEELSFYSTHYKNAQEHIPEIKKRTEETSQSISSIITNLQYQDIIKQKMQHIQETHKELVSELEKFRNQNNNTSLNEKAKYFIRIRDIAGLQAAQLMHTNKNYQEAIQKISGRFLEIGENMTIVSKKCTEYTSFDAHQQKVFLDSLKKHLTEAKDRIKQFCDFNRNFESYIDSIREILDKVMKTEKSIASKIEKLNHFKQEAQQKLNGSDEVSEKQDQLNSHINQLFTDLTANAGLLNSVIQKLSLNREELLNNVIHNASSDNYQQSVVLPEKINNYIDRLNKIEKTILDKLQQNNELSETIISEIQTSVGNIKYYKYFEKVISEIIDQLNTINFKLKEGDDEVADKNKNLVHLKENYTMNSEFLIHEKVTEGDDPDMDVEDEEGGELELF